MTKIDIISGFLGAGKTTLIKKLLEEAYKGEQVVLIENEFGEIGIDGGFLKDAGVEITEMNSGCICCSLVGDFGEALHSVIDQFHPDRVIIEPSGVGKLSDVIRAVQRAAETTPMELNCFIAVADATKCKMYMKNFGEFFNNQIEHANTIILSRAQNMSEEKMAATVAQLREHNADAIIITTPWDQITGKQILEAMETHKHDVVSQLLSEDFDDDEDECDDPDCSCHHHHDDDEEGHAHHHHHHHHDHGDEDDEHEHHHHHDHDEDEDDEHEHHHHHHDHDEDEHEHHHHHDHDHDHDHDHHHHHHADDVFTSWGVETPHKFTDEEITAALAELDTGKYGTILRAKGIVPATDGGWIHFDYVPFEPNVRRGGAEVTGRLCVIGAELKEDDVAALFHI